MGNIITSILTDVSVRSEDSIVQTLLDKAEVGRAWLDSPTKNVF